MMKVLSDSDLEKLMRGNTQPLTTIFQSIYKVCTQHVCRLTDCQPHDAEDLVMDALIVLSEKVVHDEYENNNLQSFVITVALNKWKNRRRKYSRIVFVDPNDINALQHDDIDALNETEEKEVNAIKLALKNQKGKCGILLRRNIIDGIPLELLMTELGYTSYNVIKSTKSRCLKKLRLEIAKMLNS